MRQVSFSSIQTFKKEHPINRRKFIQTGSAAAIAGAAISNVGGGADAQPAESADFQTNSQKKRVGVIGTGWYGKCDLFRLMQVAPVEVVSLCDVDSKMLADAADLVAEKQESKNRPKTYSDYRELLAAGEIDIVIIGTPDHWHSLQMIAAVEAGLDVYVQKPVGVDVVECQAMVEAARKHKCVVQVGLQRRSTPHLIDAKQKIVEAGLLGDIGLVEVYCYYHMRANSNPPDIDPPANLDYEMWTGPAPMRPYNELVHPRKWRSFQEYSNGIVGDMCVHMLDTVRWMLGLGWPTRVSSTGGILVQTDSKANIPDTQTATFDFDDLRVVWQHRTYGHAPDKEYPWGATFYGSKGTLRVSVKKFDFEPIGGGEKIHQDVVYELEEYPADKTEKDLEKHVAPAIRGHMKNFVAAIESREKPVCDIEEGQISSASCILANVAMELGRSLQWDAATQSIVDDEEANKLLQRPYRKPWVHPQPDKG